MCTEYDTIYGWMIEATRDSLFAADGSRRLHTPHQDATTGGRERGQRSADVAEPKGAGDASA